MSELRYLSPELRARLALERCGFRHSHSLGQNFILDQGLLARLLDAAGVTSDDNVLEIGPGAGVMTALLAQRGKAVLAVEVDRALEPVLGDVLAGADNARVVFGDFMKADLPALIGDSFGEAPYRVVANLPYYITADILLRLVTSKRPPRDICIMVQREAADRVMSVPDTKSWCALAATLQYFGRPEVLLEVPPEAFDPPPHVMSCFMRVAMYDDKPVRPADEARFLKLVNVAFAMRRKTLANNLKASFGIDMDAARAVLAGAGVDERVRGEALTLEQLARVADALGELDSEGGAT